MADAWNPGHDPLQKPVEPSIPPHIDAPEDQIRQRAYELWEQAGKPVGRHEEHWAQAEREVRGGGFVRT